MTLRALVELDERFVRSPRGGDAIAMDGAEQSEQLAAVGLRAASQPASTWSRPRRRAPRNGGPASRGLPGDEKTPTGRQLRSASAVNSKSADGSPDSSSSLSSPSSVVSGS